VRYAVNIPPFAEPDATVELAVEAERAGWDAVFVWDHVLHDANHPPVINPWVVLGAIAARTERIRLGPCVTPLARRETVTLDRLSGGRLIFGVGLGNPPHEDFAAFGDEADARARAARLDEALEVVTGLWSGEPFSHDGAHFQVDEVQFVPPPLQQPRPPVWIAGTLFHAKPLARAARWDGYVPIKVGRDDIEFATVDDVARVADIVRTQRGTLDGFDIVTNAGPPPHATPADYEAAGATWWMESMGHFPGWFEELRGIVLDGPPA